MDNRRFTVALVCLAVLAGLLTFAIAVTVFPHHSSNHDEGVYLQQAELLLDGQVQMESPVPESVHPWFFVQDGERLYPKYSPVPAGIFALGLLVGIPRLALLVVATLNAGLLGLVTREAFDERTGLVAVSLFVASPLFLLDSAVFLPYAPTTALNLAFAYGYLRACRADDVGSRRRYAVLAGVAVGLAFFARPFTAVLFALPFIAHALLTLGASWRQRSGDDGGGTRRLLGVARSVLERNGIVAGLGLAFVGVALGYNWVVTGDPLVFPYEAFAPRDGPGFGTRSILGYEREYTPQLALEANARVLWQLVTNWSVAPPVGVLAALLGVGAFVRSVLESFPRRVAPDGLSDRGAQALLAGLFVSVPVGNVFFWGNLNVLAALEDPTDGLIMILGPYYHFDLLVPLSAFGAAGVLLLARRLYGFVRARASRRAARGSVALALVVLLAVAGLAQAAALGPALDRSQPYTERYEQAYEPIENESFENALVFVPTPYGDWMNHPFQSLRNDPGFDGPVVYALDRDAEANFRVLDTYPDRQPYRYTYRGEWDSSFDGWNDEIHPTLTPLEDRTGDRHRVTLEAGRIRNPISASVRLAGPTDAVTYEVDALTETVAVDWVVADGRARVVDENLTRLSDRESVRFGAPTTLVLTVTFSQTGGATLTYRQEVAVSQTSDGVRLLWPGKTSVCRLVTECGTEGTYVRGADDYVTGVSLVQNLSTENATRSP
ncbi:glycosyltransferase family 39 protein [Halorientalis halophila]|uniref:DUF7846 domain-containing protein n=1 Tax=Halorientalis halophila TaxID=3108499 RepID=UPI00300A7455